MYFWKEKRLQSTELNSIVSHYRLARFLHSVQFSSRVESSLMLRRTVSRPVCLGIKHTSGAYDQILIIVRQFRVCCCGALSLTRRRVRLLYMLQALASVVFLGSESLGTRDHILLFQIWDFPFRRLLRLAVSQWKYSTTRVEHCPILCLVIVK
jgi:hypothetical protein